MTSPLPDSDQASSFVPADIYLPFFAYGVFKPGELAFLQIKNLVAGCQDCSIAAVLRIRNGLPIASPALSGELPGRLIHFRHGLEEKAYRRIAELEPEIQYRWEVASSQSGHVNYLARQKPEKGTVFPDNDEWNGHDDLLFTVALNVVDETLQQNHTFEWDLKPLFRLEMAYLLLWTVIERYASLRYHLADKATKKVMKFANEFAFMSTLKEHVTEQREVCRADDPTEKIVLDSKSPERALAYYYQIRSNLVHRGKSFRMTMNALKSRCASSWRYFEQRLLQLLKRLGGSHLSINALSPNQGPCLTHTQKTPSSSNLRFSFSLKWIGRRYRLWRKFSVLVAQSGVR